MPDKQKSVLPHILPEFWTSAAGSSAGEMELNLVTSFPMNAVPEELIKRLQALRDTEDALAKLRAEFCNDVIAAMGGV